MVSNSTLLVMLEEMKGQLTIISGQDAGVEYSTSGTYSHLSNITEQTAISMVITSETTIDNIFFDFVNLSQNTTVRVKAEIDGTNPRTLDTLTWTSSDDDGVMINGFTSDVDIFITIQSTPVSELSTISIPYRVV